MAATPGNEFYKLAKNTGRPKKYTPEEFALKCEEYFNYMDNNPYKKKKYEIYKGETKEYIEEIKQPYTIEGLCLYVGITSVTFRNLENDKEYLSIITYARDRIYNNKLSGATDGTFNANIVIRDLGLKDSATVIHETSIKELQPNEIKQLKESLSSMYGEVKPVTIDITPEEG